MRTPTTSIAVRNSAAASRYLGTRVLRGQTASPTLGMGVGTSMVSNCSYQNVHISSKTRPNEVVFSVVEIGMQEHQSRYTESGFVVAIEGGPELCVRSWLVKEPRRTVALYRCHTPR